MRSSERLISIYPSHNATLATYIDGRYRVLELERLYKIRYYQTFYLNDDFSINREHTEEILTDSLRSLEDIWDIKNDFDHCIYAYFKEPEIFAPIKAKKYSHIQHHHAHAACAFYQSSFYEAIAISYDGWGDDGTFNIYLCHRRDGVKLHRKIDINLGRCYRLFGLPIKDIKKKLPSTDRFYIHDRSNLAVPGKLMALAAYGEVVQEWIDPMRDSFMGHATGSFSKSTKDTLFEVLPALSERIGIDLSPDALDEGAGANFAATTQHVLEEIAIEQLTPVLADLPNLPICVTGGVALNVKLNQLLLERFQRDVFVPPNPDDGGIAVGALLDCVKPEEPAVLTYAGPPILDINRLAPLANHYRAKKVTTKDVAELLASGKIIGIMRGDSEVGPRALGNRSILCDPGRVDIQEVVNSEIKGRGYYQPCAPVTLEEDREIYFEMISSSPFMSFCPRVKESFKDQLPGIVHRDGTARVQTVNELQNPFLYQLLVEFKKLKGYSVLVNTSLNIKGKPIISSIEDGLEILHETSLDYLLVENWLF